MYLLLDEEIKKLIFKESRIVPCHKLTRQERICNEQCLLQNTSCIRKPQVISGRGWGGGVRTPCTLPLDPPLYNE